MKAYMFPGQGSQKKGMGAGLFEKFPDITAKADQILGYSIKTLCLEDPEDKLGQTEYTQPALYTLNALSYLDKISYPDAAPDYLLGHSLGEYNALFAAGIIDFESGLKLVKKRGELMSKARDGGMAAILNCEPGKIAQTIQVNGFSGIDIANYNSPKQTVISGPTNEIEKLKPFLDSEGAICIPLNVSAAFHSRYMKPAGEQFASELKGVTFKPAKIPVISNVKARPYNEAEISENLKNQISHSVQWTDSIRYLMGKGVTDFEEIGPGDVLTKLVNTIKKTSSPLVVEERVEIQEAKATVLHNSASAINFSADRLGSSEFRRDYNVRYCYISGAMAKRIASKELVVNMAKAKLLSFYGTGGVRPEEVQKDIDYIKSQLDSDAPYGMNLLCNLNNTAAEMEMVDLFLRNDIRVIEAAAYAQITPALVKYRLTGLSRDKNGAFVIKNRIVAKISRPEVAELFLNSAPQLMIDKLLEQGAINREQAELSRFVAMADDLCVEADSGGHTDMGVLSVLLPAIIRQRDTVCGQRGYKKMVRVGAAGGIGTPEAAASAFILGAAFVLTGSINQCTIEAGVSDEVKDMLSVINVQDTSYAPAGDMFEIGAKIQVLKKGVFFPARANKLYDLWRTHERWEDIDIKTRQQIEEKYFGRSFESVYEETRNYYNSVMPQQIEKAEKNPKHKLALVFRWYFVHSLRSAISGDSGNRVNYQIHTGPSLGAFNQWVKGTELESWRNRHPDLIAEKMMLGTAALLSERFGMMTEN